MLMPGFFAGRIWQEVSRLQTKLGCDEARHLLRYHFARLQQSSGEAQGTELKRKAHLVLRAPSRLNMLNVIIRQRVVLQQGRLVSRQVQEAGALPCRQNTASWQFGRLRVL